MPRIALFATGFILLVAGGAHAEPQTCYGPGDVNADASVNAADLAAFATCMAGPDNPAPGGCDPATFDRSDLETDGDVDLRDFAALALLVDETYFDYGPRRDNLEAEMLATDLTGELRAPDVEYDRILGDLALIRAAYPELTDVIDDPDYAPNQLLVGIDARAAGSIDALNEFYQVTDQQIHDTWRVLTFCDNLNPETLGVIYDALSQVDWAGPNYLYGIDDYITIEIIGTTWRYHIDDGFWDCFDGCDCHRDWVIDVDGIGNVKLISYEEWGWPYCEF